MQQSQRNKNKETDRIKGIKRETQSVIFYSLIIFTRVE
jgi:hypothetical protein